MSHSNDQKLEKLTYYVTAEYECSYLPQQSARSLVAAPAHFINTKTYSRLIDYGFRRSGLFTYKPHCLSCNACIPIRLPVKSYKPSRNQKRVLKRSPKLHYNMLELELYEDHLRLYEKYQLARHADGDMAQDIEKQYNSFLLASSVDSILIEYRTENYELKIVSLVDVLENGLSSVYTFFDPESKFSLGTYSILSQIQLCKEMNLDWLYLGYWIEQCQKMSYKSNFKPHQIFKNNSWIDVND